jgi:membrane protein
MRIDENGNAWWHWVIGALVVVSVAFATAVTAGTFALALGINSTVVGTLTSSVALSGILVGGLNLFVQWSSGLEMPNIKALAINTALGGITGALSGGANLLITGTKIAAQLGKQVIVNIAISLGAYMIQSLINKNKLTVEGAVIAIGSGMIAGLTFNQPLISSVVITMAIELAGYAWENIRKIFEG